MKTTHVAELNTGKPCKLSDVALRYRPRRNSVSSVLAGSISVTSKSRAMQNGCRIYVHSGTWYPVKTTHIAELKKGNPCKLTLWCSTLRPLFAGRERHQAKPLRLSLEQEDPCCCLIACRGYTSWSTYGKRCLRWLCQHDW